MQVKQNPARAFFLLGLDSVGELSLVEEGERLLAKEPRRFDKIGLIKLWTCELGYRCWRRAGFETSRDCPEGVEFEIIKTMPGNFGSKFS